MDLDVLDLAKQEYLEQDDLVRVEAFAAAVDECNALALGDYIEVGTLWGISLRLIHRFMDQSRMLYSFDTFEGFDQRDLDTERVYLPKHKWRTGTSLTPGTDKNFFPTSIERVHEHLGNPTNLKCVKGWFPESFVGYENIDWRFAHIDVDLYQPSLLAMRAVWQRLVPGGIIIVHDYGETCFAAHTAVDHFCAEVGTTRRILNDKHHSALIRKSA